MTADLGQICLTREAMIATLDLAQITYNDLVRRDKLYSRSLLYISWHTWLFLLLAVIVSVSTVVLLKFSNLSFEYLTGKSSHFPEF